MSTQANPAAVGAIIKWSVSGQVHSRLKTSGGSFMSSHDPREVLGIGKAAKVHWVEIRWPTPSHHVDRLVDVPIDQYLTVVEGQGISRK